MRPRRGAVERLRAYLEQFGADGDDLFAQLAEAWDQLSGGDDTKMAARKLDRDRVESPEWHPPVLTFTIERHGGAARGSPRAEKQRWVIDLDARTARPEPAGQRQLRPARQTLDVAPVVGRIIAAIDAGADDPVLEWSKDTSSVRVLIRRALQRRGSLLPPRRRRGSSRRVRRNPASAGLAQLGDRRRQPRSDVPGWHCRL